MSVASYVLCSTALKFTCLHQGFGPSSLSTLSLDNQGQFLSFSHALDDKIHITNPELASDLWNFLCHDLLKPSASVYNRPFAHLTNQVDPSEFLISSNLYISSFSLLTKCHLHESRNIELYWSLSSPDHWSCPLTSHVKFTSMICIIPIFLFTSAITTQVQKLSIALQQPSSRFFHFYSWPSPTPCLGAKTDLYLRNQSARVTHLLNIF